MVPPIRSLSPKLRAFSVAQRWRVGRRQSEDLGGARGAQTRWEGPKGPVDGPGQGNRTNGAGCLSNGA